jgi:hypothetical protein
MKKILVNMPIATLTAILATGVFTAGCMKTTAPTDDTMSGSVNTGSQITAGIKVKAPTQEYKAPSGDMENITVELTLDGDKIIDYNIVYVANHAKSKGYQAGFKAKIGEKLIGQSIKDLNVGIVNGAL